MAIKNVRIKTDRENVAGNRAAHLNYVAPEMRGLVPVSMAGRITVKCAAGVFADTMVGAGLRPSEAKRQKTLWERTADGVASPSVRDFRGPAKRLGQRIDMLDGAAHVAVHVLTEDATICRASLTGIGDDDGITVTQRESGEWRVSGKCETYRDVQRLFITAQALAALTEETGGYPAYYELADALEGYGVFRNYSVRRANLKPVSFRY